jgi:adenylosuccinate synthase
MYITQGGANAGHTIYDEAGTKYALHQVRVAVHPHQWRAS